MAFDYGQFSSGFGQQDYGNAFDNSDSFGAVFGGDATVKALDASRKKRQEAMTDMASGAIQQVGQREQALAYARGWQEQVDKERRAQRKRQSGGFLGGAFNFLGTAASFIPGAGPLIGAGLKAVGGGFS